MNVLQLRRENASDRLVRLSKMTQRIRVQRDETPRWRVRVRRQLQADLDEAMAAIEAEVDHG